MFTTPISRKAGLQPDDLAECTDRGGRNNGDDAAKDEDMSDLRLRQLAHQIEKAWHEAGGEIIAGTATLGQQQVDQ
jgi:hypothetical protein